MPSLLSFFSEPETAIQVERRMRLRRIAFKISVALAIVFLSLAVGWGIAELGSR